MGYVFLHHIAGKVAVAHFVPVSGFAQDIHFFAFRHGLQRTGFLVGFFAQHYLGVGHARICRQGPMGKHHAAPTDHQGQCGAKDPPQVAVYAAICLIKDHVNQFLLCSGKRGPYPSQVTCLIYYENIKLSRRICEVLHALRLPKSSHFDIFSAKLGKLLTKTEIEIKLSSCSWFIHNFVMPWTHRYDVRG